VQAAVDSAKVRAAELDRLLHERTPPLELAGKACILVDDGLATGATMVAAVRWARARRAARVVAAVPVAAQPSLPLIEVEADDVVCPHAFEHFVAVGVWYAEFGQVEDEEVRRLLAARPSAQLAPPVALGGPRA